MTKVEVMEVVRTKLELRGTTEDDIPVHRVTQYWSKEGELLAENCPVDECDCGL